MKDNGIDDSAWLKNYALSAESPLSRWNQHGVWIRKLTETTSAGCDACGKRFLSGEVGRHDCNAGYEKAATAQPNTHGLGEHDLPVSCRNAGHHHAKDGEK